MVSVCMIDRSTLFREGLRRLFEDAGVRIVMEASSVTDVQAAPRRVPADIVLTDLAEPGHTPALQIDLLRAACPGSYIVALTDRPDNAYVDGELLASLDGYLLKESSADVLVQSLRLIALGEPFVTRALLPLAAGEAGPVRPTDTAADTGLSEMDRLVLSMLVAGAPNKVIALRLAVSEGAVKARIKALLRRIGARNRTQAAIWAKSNGIAADETCSHPVRPATIPPGSRLHRLTGTTGVTEGHPLVCERAQPQQAGWANAPAIAATCRWSVPQQPPTTARPGRSRARSL